MGAKDLYLLQIVQYSSDEHEKKPSHWAFFIHYPDKNGALTGEGEVHEIQMVTTQAPSSNAHDAKTSTTTAAITTTAIHKTHKYSQRYSKLFTRTFRGACTLGLFYKKNLYKIYEEFEGVKVRTTIDPQLAPRVWVEDCLEAMRKAGVVLLGPSFRDMVYQAYDRWRAHRDEKKRAAEKLWGDATKVVEELDTPSNLVKRHYSFPYTHFATC